MDAEAPQYIPFPRLRAFVKASLHRLGVHRLRAMVQAMLQRLCGHTYDRVSPVPTYQKHKSVSPSALDPGKRSETSTIETQRHPIRVDDASIAYSMHKLVIRHNSNCTGIEDLRKIFDTGLLLPIRGIKILPHGSKWASPQGFLAHLDTGADLSCVGEHVLHELGISYYRQEHTPPELRIYAEGIGGTAPILGSADMRYSFDDAPSCWFKSEVVVIKTPQPGEPGLPVDLLIGRDWLNAIQRQLRRLGNGNLATVSLEVAMSD